MDGEDFFRRLRQALGNDARANSEGPLAADLHMFQDSKPAAGGEGAPASSLDLLLERLRQQGHGSPLVSGEIARGGMGVILRVKDEMLHRELAMKVVLGEADQPAGRELLRRFLAEALITAQLDHPGVIPIHWPETRPPTCVPAASFPWQLRLPRRGPPRSQHSSYSPAA